MVSQLISLLKHTPRITQGSYCSKKFPGSHRKAVTGEEESIRQGSLSSCIMGNGISNRTALTIFLMPMPFPLV